MPSRTHLFRSTLMAAVLLIGLPSMALANNDEEPEPTGSTQVPELSADGAGGALALLIGGALMLGDRLRKHA